VNDKKRIGNWEIATIIGKQQKQAVVSIVERVSKRTVRMVTAATIAGLKSYLGSVFSITGDNGSEFAYHEEISKELGNENTNGLVR
jgi:IS30 family transposase